MSKEKTVIKSVDRAMRIVDLFTEHKPDWRLSDISKTLRIHKSTVHGLLRTLAQHGYIDQHVESGKYRLGLRFVEKGTLVLNHLDIRTVARPYLEQLSSSYGESTHLVILDDLEAVYIDKVEGDSAIGMYSRVGKRAPLYCTAVGKILVSETDDHELNTIANQLVYKSHTPHTITNSDQFQKEVRLVGKQGFAVDDEELEIGLRCVAVPIRNRYNEIVAAISLSGPSKRLDHEKQPVIISAMKHQAMLISEQLGYEQRETHRPYKK